MIRAAVLAIGLFVGSLGAGIVAGPIVSPQQEAQAQYCYYDSYIHPHWHQWGPYPWQGYFIAHEHQTWTCI